MNQTNRTKTAVIPAIANAPARDAHVSLDHQWAVDLGIVMADESLPDLDAIPLHVFVSGSADSFRSAIQRAATDAGQRVHPDALHAAIDAFAAGLLGRLQQYLLAGLADPARAGASAPPHLH